MKYFELMTIYRFKTVTDQTEPHKYLCVCEMQSKRTQIKQMNQQRNENYLQLNY